MFDNANAPDEIEPLLPRGGGGRVLITSRNPSWPFAAPLDVPTLSRPAAVSFLLERTGQHDAAAADALAEELGDLPLALEQAAAYMVETGSALADYLELFRTRRSELWSEEKPPAGYPATVGTTWTMAVDRLRTEEPRAVDLLHLCAFLAPEAIPRRLLTEHHAALPPELGARRRRPAPPQPAARRAPSLFAGRGHGRGAELPPPRPGRHARRSHTGGSRAAGSRRRWR